MKNEEREGHSDTQSLDLIINFKKYGNVFFEKNNVWFFSKNCRWTKQINKLQHAGPSRSNGQDFSPERCTGVSARLLCQFIMIDSSHLVSVIQEQKDWPDWLKAMNPEQIAEIKQAMEKFDVNGDGVIDRDDVCAALKRDGMDIDSIENEIADFMRQFDKNGGVQCPGRFCSVQFLNRLVC